jgi:hypothetical protein
MPVAIKNQKDFFSGLMFVVVGAAFGIGASQYNVGTGARMGPGYFPMILGILLAILGSLIALKALGSEKQPGTDIGRIAWKPLVFVIGANISFGVLLTRNICSFLTFREQLSKKGNN